MNAMFENPGLLKLDLAIRGARLGEDFGKRQEIFRVPTLLDHAGRTLEVILPEDVFVNVPVGERFTRESPYLLGTNGDGFAVWNGEKRCDVRVVPQPDFYTRSTRSGLPMWQVGTAYGGYLAINPATGCAFTRDRTACRFCDVPTRVGERAAPLSVADVVETVRDAFAEGIIEFVYFHIGYMEGDDAGILFLEPYVRAIKRHFDTLVAVQLQPPRSNEWIDRTYAMGVDALSYSIEIHDADLLQLHCPGRTEHVGRDRYYDALGHAATVFPSGTVWSDLIVGLESAESTMAGIDALVAMRALPVLSVFRPLDNTPLSDHPLPSVDDVVPIFAHLFSAVHKSRINMHWVRDLSFAVTPLEARFFADEEIRTNAGLSQFYRSRLGTIAARNLSRLRRRLRVRQVSDSFDSSHL